MSPAFFESFVNIPHTVLGKRLQPFSLNHLIWLYHLESPLVFTNRATSLVDLELAVLVCSAGTNEEILSAISSEERFWRIWAKSLWRKRNRKKEFKEELQKFLAYNDDFLAMPAMFAKDEAAETNEAIPWILQHAAALIQNTGWSEETVFRMPVGKLVWFNLAFGYLKTGETSVISEKEEAAMQALRALTGKS